jgi:hypothetical protein
MEYSQDRLKKEIRILEQELEAYKDRDKDRAAVEAALFLVGLLIGVAVGFYSSQVL